MAEHIGQTPAEPANEYWSLNKASVELGINKSTLSTDAARGRIQWHDVGGTKKLFVPELFSHYAERLKKRSERAERVLNSGTSTESEQPKQSKNSELNSALEAKAELVQIMKGQIDDLRHDRDQWRKQAEEAGKQLTEVLTVMKALPAPAKSDTATPAEGQLKTDEPPKRKKFLGLF